MKRITIAVAMAVLVGTALVGVVSSYGHDSNGALGARHITTYPKLMSDLERRQLFGIALGKPVPKECQHLLGGTNDVRSSFIFAEDPKPGPHAYVAYNLNLKSETSGTIFEYARVLIEQKSQKVVAIGAKFYAPKESRKVIPRDGGPGKKIDVRELLWSPRACYRNMLADLFGQYGSCETEIRGEMWDSGNIYQTVFYVNVDTAVEINFHEQFGNELVLRDVHVPGVGQRWMGRCDRMQRPLDSLWNEVVKRHPAVKLYWEYEKRRPSSSSILESHYGISVASAGKGGCRIREKPEDGPVVPFSKVESGVSDRNRYIAIEAYEDSSCTLRGSMMVCDSPAYAYRLLQKSMLKDFPATYIGRVFKRLPTPEGICVCAQVDDFDRRGREGHEFHDKIVMMVRGNVLMNFRMHCEDGTMAQRLCNLFDRYIER